MKLTILTEQTHIQIDKPGEPNTHSILVLPSSTEHATTEINKLRMNEKKRRRKKTKKKTMANGYVRDHESKMK